MSFGNPKSGLLKAMIDLMNELDPTRPYNSTQITSILAQRGHWDNSPAKTPERTVNSYFSQNQDIFLHVGSNSYCLQLGLVQPTEQIEIADFGSDNPPRVAITTYRVLRDTEIARRLKGLYGNRCQLCGERIQLPHGFYSEAHHIKPLGRPHNGPDVAENILVLCPNHHVICDHGTFRLSVQDFHTAPQHNIAQEFVDYHNEVLFVDKKN